MEEKIIIQSTRLKFRKACLIGGLIAGALSVLLIGYAIFTFISDILTDGIRDALRDCRLMPAIRVSILAFIIVYLPIFIVYLITKSMSIVVTDKRVYGKTYFGRSVDLPLDSISAVGSTWLKGIAVSTSSGRIAFLLIKNAKDIHTAIRSLLINRQERKAVAPVSAPVSSGGNADELRKYKDLLDAGVITQEEFNAKKKQLLGL